MRLAMPLFAVASLTLTACIGAPGEVDEQTGTADQAITTSNALTGNALTGNALTGNALTGNALTGNALTGNALTGNALTGNALTDPNAREVLKYIVSCALPQGESVEFTVGAKKYHYDGELGLTPEWGDPNGSCDEDCQGWVSACLLARLDYLGKHREISVRGDNPALMASKGESKTYSAGEATYFGNVFTGSDAQRRYGCLYPGQTEDTRVCGPTIEGCVVNIDASCDQACGPQQPDGSFPDCRPGDADKDDPVYHQTITVFLKP